MGKRLQVGVGKCTPVGKIRENPPTPPIRKGDILGKKKRRWKGLNGKLKNLYLGAGMQPRGRRTEKGQKGHKEGIPSLGIGSRLQTN